MSDTIAELTDLRSRLDAVRAHCRAILDADAARSTPGSPGAHNAATGVAAQVLALLEPPRTSDPQMAVTARSAASGIVTDPVGARAAREWGGATHRIMVELDGATVPLEDCDWVLRWVCGCPHGVLSARGVADEEQAWREFYEKKSDRTQADKRGDTLELMTHERYSAEVYPLMLVDCPHGPSRDGTIPLPLETGAAS